MLDVAVMIEGQDGLNWPRWQAIARATEAGGFAGLFRSDHFVNPSGPWRDALELWTSMTWLASHTRRIEFGPLVSPVSFRDPRITAWTAAAVDDLSGGRLRLGLGAGWQEREHAAFGYELGDMRTRFARFEEGLEVVARLLGSRTTGAGETGSGATGSSETGSDEPVSFDGRVYRLDGARLMPRPARPGGPPITIGGRGPRRTLPLVARYADEWNAVSGALADFPALNARLDELLRERGRDPSSVRRSFMTTVVFGRDRAELERKLNGRAVEELRAQHRVVGTPDMILAQLEGMARLGIQRVMLRWEELDDPEGLEALGRAVVPRLGG